MTVRKSSSRKTRGAALAAGPLAALTLLGGGALAQTPPRADGPLFYPIESYPGDPDAPLPGALGPQAMDQRAPLDPGPAANPPEKIDPTKPSIYYAEVGRPNIGGFWRPALGRRPIYYVEGKVLPAKGTVLKQYGFPYKPEWVAVLNARYHGEAVNMPYGDPSASCFPQGMFHNYIGYNSPLEITQTPGRITMVEERLTQIRRVETDGSLHPADFIPTAEGHSIGHWEGDTLVVDTVGVRPEFTFGYHMPHSSKVHFVERFRRLDPETLAIYITIEDPLALSTSVQTTLYYKLGPAGDKMSEDFCVENNRNNPDENLIVKANIDPHKYYGFDLPPGASREDTQ